MQEEVKKVSQNDLHYSEIEFRNKDFITHTRYMKGTWYEFQLSRKDTQRFNSVLRLLDDEPDFINLILSITKPKQKEDDKLSNERLQAFNLIYHNLKSLRYNPEQFLLNPSRSLIELMDSFVVNKQFDEFYDETEATLEDIEEAFQIVMLCYISNHPDYNYKLLYLGWDA